MIGNDAGLSPFWALDGSYANRLSAALAARGTNGDGGSAPRSALTKDGAIGVVDVTGVLTKYRTYVQDYFGGFASTEIAAAVNVAAADPSVSGILLRIESPGGQVSGLSEAADAIFKARSSKPVWAYCEDIAASGAFWLASQAQVITANAAALVGSIGTYTVVTDLSKMAADAGVKVTVVKAGDYKGIGVAGTEFTPAQLAHVQETINSLNALFVAAVSRGRGLKDDKLAKLADGRVHVGAAALQMGLIDRVQSFAGTLADFRSHVAGAGGARATAAAKDPKAHAVAEWNANAYGCRQSFRSEATFIAYRATPASPKLSPEATGNPIAEVDRRVAAIKAESPAVAHGRAVAEVFTSDPDLHAAYLAAHNAGNERRGRR